MLSKSTLVPSILLGFLIATTAYAQPGRDLLTASSPTGGSYAIHHLEGTGGPAGPWSPNAYVNGINGVPLALDVAELPDGSVFVVNVVPSIGTEIVRRSTPFLPSPFSVPSTSAAVVVPAVAGEDPFMLKVDRSVPGSESLIACVRVPNAGGIDYFLRRIGLTGTTLNSVMLASPATAFVHSLSVDPGTGTIRLMTTDTFIGGHRVTAFDATLTPIPTESFTLPAGIDYTVLGFSPRPVTPFDPIVAAGKNAAGQLVVQRFTLGGMLSTTSIVVPTISTSPSWEGLSVDDVGDCYLSMKDGGATSELVHVDRDLTTVTMTGVQLSGPFCWTGRSATGTQGFNPGNGLGTGVTMRAPLVGDTQLIYNVPTPPVPVSCFTFALSGGVLPAPVVLGPQAFLLLDTSNPFVIVGTPFAPSFPNISLTMPALPPSMAGQTMFTQFLACDATTGEVLTSNCVAFTVGFVPTE